MFLLFAKLRRIFQFWFLKKAMRQYGCTSPVIVDRTGHLVDGNRRVLVARELGIKVPVLRLKAEVEYVDPHELEIGCSLDFKEIWWEKAK